MNQKFNLNHYLFLLLLGLSIQIASAQNIPPAPSPMRFVNDYVGLLQKEEYLELEEKLKLYADSISTEVTVVIIDNLEGYPAAEYASLLARKWKLGNSEKDNAVLMLVSIKERKIRLEIGLGVEEYIDDEEAIEIINQEILPYFKEGDFLKGLLNSTEKIVQEMQSYN